MVDVVTFGEEGVPGPTGPAGPTGPLGGTPDVGGFVVLDTNTRFIIGPYTQESADSRAGSGVLQNILSLTLALKAYKIVFEVSVSKNDGTKVQTLDGARRIKLSAGVPTLVVSGTDVADDADALGAAIFVEIANPFTGVYVLRVRVNADASSSAAAAVRWLHS